MRFMLVCGGEFQNDMDMSCRVQDMELRVEDV